MTHRTIKQFLEWITQFPEDWYIWAYEGEVRGVIVAHGYVSDDGFDRIGV